MSTYGEWGATYGGGVPGIPPPPPVIVPPTPPAGLAAGAIVPHFALPFRFATPYAAVAEQDTLDEIADCLLAILVCPHGFRVELPSFGLPDPTFDAPAPSLDVMRSTIERWEPRARALLNEYPDLIDVLQAHVEVYAQARTEV